MIKSVGLVIVLVAFIGQSKVWSQEKGQIRIGTGMVMGTNSGINDSGNEKPGFGINLGADYFIIENLSIAPSYTYFFEASFESPLLDISTKASTFDIDAKYYFLNGSVGVYGLLGASIGFIKTETTLDLGSGPQTSSDSESDFGSNIGVGADFNISDKVFLNAQIKHNLPLVQLVFNLGVGFSIN